MKCRQCGASFRLYSRVEHSAPPLLFLLVGMVILLVALLADRWEVVPWVDRILASGWLIASSSVIAWLIARHEKPTCPRCDSACTVFPWSW
ncbi:MAG: hypothetical protein VB875_19495 [Pirellulales bacterium]